MSKYMSCILIALIMLAVCIFTKAAPYQVLEPRKGHVPVYIRHGDEALSNIHPGLAEAFKEDSVQPLRAENLITEVSTTNQPALAEAASTNSSTESDIASFDAIKSKDA
ncbi:uncharacterized protein [Drosophila virilis]|uniref:Secreted protein n=1 Tax=Drosophila virilis TaxID=7244 RepID=B4MGX2_DROVI|nr:uncharacterized protein LOC6636922 [Drosophila virilis]EDW62908.1 uncharacterized protein Dvir_GJ16105 [Drosophila virilis]